MVFLGFSHPHDPRRGKKNLLEKYGEPVPDALVESAIRNIQLIEDEDFYNFKVSVNHRMYFYQ